MFRVYISGPITASTREEEEQNVRKAADVAYWCAMRDMAVYWPHGTWYIDQLAKEKGEQQLGYNFLYQDLEWIRQCHAVLCLPGPSEGKNVEVAWALENAIPVYYWKSKSDWNALLAYKDKIEGAGSDKLMRDIVSNAIERIKATLVAKSNQDTGKAHTSNTPVGAVHIKDSGHRREFSSGATRDRDVTKPRPDLISPFAEERLGDWLRMGAEKYSARNWEKGMPASECLASLCRHVVAVKQGRDDGEDHLAAIMFNAMAIIHFESMVARGVLPRDLLDLQSYAQGE